MAGRDSRSYPERDLRMTTNIRTFSSCSGSSRKKQNFKLDALLFSVSPEEALEQFSRWATKEQGIVFMYQKSIWIAAAYVPVWSFDVNVRFVTEPEPGRKWFDLKPEPFTVYQNNVVHVPGLSAYAGYSYRRSLVNPIHNTLLVFMGDKTVPFGSWMLRPMSLAGGGRIDIFPDP